MYQGVWLSAWHVACSWSCTDIGSIMQKCGRTETAKTALLVIGRVLRTVFPGVYSHTHKLRMHAQIQIGRV